MIRDNREAEKEMERRRSRRKAEKLRRLKRRRRSLILAILAVLFLPIVGVRIYFGVNPVILKNSVIDVELKDSVNLKGNIRYVFAGKVSQVKITGSVDNTKEGDYQVTYSWKGRKKTVTVKVRDTKPPVLEMKNSYTVDLGGAVTADDFVKKVKDASEVSLKILNAKKWDKAGEYSISVEAKDIYGNKTTGKSKLILEEDKTPPEISGAEDTEILQGKTMDFSSGVAVKDNADPDPSLSVDSTKADLNTPGTYVVTYLAKDRSGNETKVERKITVKTNPEWKEKIVYLTFDDGPSENTGKILDILKQYHVKGTFFVTGNHQEHDDLIKRAFDEGNSIGLHTYTHDYATVYASEQAYFDDLQKISDLVEKITGEKSTLIRFPGGSSNTVSADYVQGLMTTLTKAVHEKGYEYFDWNCDSTDASGNNVAVSKLVQNATLCSADHVTILMHDTDAKDTTVEALPQIIEYYRGQGYSFKGLTKDSVAAHHRVNN